MWKLLKIRQIVYILVCLQLFEHGFQCDVEETFAEKMKHLPSGHSGLYELEGEKTVPSHHVAVVTRSANGTSLLCGGSVLSNRFILTAAHCLESSYDATVNLYTTPNVSCNVKTNKFKIHPKWRPLLLQNDIALVELPRPPDLPDLNPIQMSPVAKIAPKQQATVYGWEKRNAQPIWSKYEVVIMSNKECAKYYGALITKCTVCAERTGPGRSCHGFSGGGLVIDGMLVGVVSFGVDQCNLGYPIVYTKISRYKKWIEKNFYLLSLSNMNFTV